MAKKINSGIVFTGIPSIEELKSSPGFPSEERLKKGPVAVIECVQEIPCDPCEEACPFEAIKVGKPITNLPILYEDKCVGCGKCIPFCPGLAIFLVDTTFSKTEALVKFPYEYLPLPKVNSLVDAVDREGNIVTEARIIKVDSSDKYDCTVVVSIAIPKRFAQKVRGIALNRGDKNGWQER